MTKVQPHVAEAYSWTIVISRLRASGLTQETERKPHRAHVALSRRTGSLLDPTAVAIMLAGDIRAKALQKIAALSASSTTAFDRSDLDRLCTACHSGGRSKSGPNGAPSKSLNWPMVGTDAVSQLEKRAADLRLVDSRIRGSLSALQNGTYHQLRTKC